MENSKIKKCKYCGTNIIWDDSIKQWVEESTKQIHTTDRCTIQMPKTGLLQPIKLDEKDPTVVELRKFSKLIDTIQAVAYEDVVRNHPNIKPDSRDFGPIVSKRTDQLLYLYVKNFIEVSK